MKIDNVTVELGLRVVDRHKGLGVVASIQERDFTVSFTNNEQGTYLDGGYLGGEQRIGFTRKVFVELPIGSSETIVNVLKALGVTIKEGF